MKTVLYILIAGALLAATGCARHTNKISRIGFSVRYGNGWSAHTGFSEDLSVSGAHISGGEDVFVHMVEDTASKELWARLKVIALKVAAIEPINLDPDPDPVYIIRIELSDNRVLEYERELTKEYSNINLRELSNLIGKNQRIYSHQKGKPWRLK